MQQVQQKKDTNSHVFPIAGAGSVTFAATGATLTRAELRCGGTLLSVINFPENDANSEKSSTGKKETLISMADIGMDMHNGASSRSDNASDGPEIELDFFGGKSFHAGLTSAMKSTVTLFTTEQKIPTLKFYDVLPALHWEDYPDGVFIEPVSVSSENGIRELDMVYTFGVVGFRARAGK